MNTEIYSNIQNTTTVMGDSKNPEDAENSTLPPSWLDVALIQQALRNAGEENSQVAKITAQLAIAAGDNYASTIYRVKAILTDGSERPFIVKGPAPGASMTNFVKDTGLFKREIILLTDIVPQLQALLEEAAPGKFPPLAPRCYLHGTHPVEFLVIEDLAPPGFKVADRRRGLGLRHSLLALHNLARFHAASYALLQRQPGLVQRLDNIWRMANQGMDALVEGALQATADACRTWPDFEQYAERIEKFKIGAMKLMGDLNDPKPGAFNVIAHGDFWATNMMFRYEDDYPMEQRPVDFQLSHVASPAVDLVYFLAGSVSEDVHTHYQDLLLREYHFTLKETMELLGHQAPPLESLLEAFEVHGPFSLFIALGGLPIMKSEGAGDIEAMFEGDNSSLGPLYEQPVVRRWMQRTIPDYTRRGWLPA